VFAQDTALNACYIHPIRAVHGRKCQRAMAPTRQGNLNITPVSQNFHCGSTGAKTRTSVISETGFEVYRALTPTGAYTADRNQRHKKKDSISYTEGN